MAEETKGDKTPATGAINYIFPLTYVVRYYIICVMPPKNRISISCDHCGKSFERPPSLINKHNFCSWQCKTLYQIKRPWVSCSNCGQLFRPRPFQARTRNRLFCNRQCYIRWYTNGTSLLNCDWCGIAIKVKPSRQKECDHHFCSKSHYQLYISAMRRYANNPNWRGGRLIFRGPNWQKQRKLAAQRDNYTCQICNKQGIRVFVHHIIPFGFFGLVAYEQANRLENLVTLCSSCHVKAGRKRLGLHFLPPPEAPKRKPLMLSGSTKKARSSLISQQRRLDIP